MKLLSVAIMILTASVALAAQEKNVANLNRAFVDWMNGGEGDKALLGALLKDEEIINVRKDILGKNKKSLKLQAFGGKVCRIEGAREACWSMVSKAPKLGIKFDGAEKVFYPKATSFGQFTKELNGFFETNSRNAFMRFFVPEASAQNIANPSRISITDTALIYATAKYWRVADPYPSIVTDYDKTESWVPQALKDSKVQCYKDRAELEYKDGNRVSKIVSSKPGVYTLQTSDKNGAKVFYQMKFVTHKDMEKCSKYSRTSPYYTGAMYGYYGCGGPYNSRSDNATFKTDFEPYRSWWTDKVVYPSSCKETGNSCSYPLPQQSLNVKKCATEACADGDLTATSSEDLNNLLSDYTNTSQSDSLKQQLMSLVPMADVNKSELGLDEAALVDANKELMEKKKSLESTLKGLVPGADFKKDDLGVTAKQRSTLSGSELSQFDKAQKDWLENEKTIKDRLNKIALLKKNVTAQIMSERDERETRLLNEAAKSTIVKQCCESTNCRQEIYKTSGLDLVPAKETGGSK